MDVWQVILEWKFQYTVNIEGLFWKNDYLMLLLLLFCLLKKLSISLRCIFSCFPIDLSVFMTRSRENGSIIVGDSLNLTCKLNCSGNLAEVQWFKNGELMQHSHPVLTFSSVTAKDSGNYSCSLRNLKTVSEEFRIHIEGWLNW